jgi:hypothetical protein
MRTRLLPGAALVASLFLPAALAHAAEVTRLPSNNMFATAVSTDPATETSTGVFVTRVKGGPKGPVDSIFVIISGPSGSSLIAGTLPTGAFHADAKSASLDVDISEIMVTFEDGTLPETGLISVDWHATDVTRISGNTKIDIGNGHVNIVGTSSSSPATVTGSVFGTALVGPTGDLSTTKQAVIIVSKD